MVCAVVAVQVTWLSRSEGTQIHGALCTYHSGECMWGWMVNILIKLVIPVFNSLGELPLKNTQHKHLSNCNKSETWQLSQLIACKVSAVLFTHSVSSLQQESSCTKVSESFKVFWSLWPTTKIDEAIWNNRKKSFYPNIIRTNKPRFCLLSWLVSGAVLKNISPVRWSSALWWGKLDSARGKFATIRRFQTDLLKCGRK